MILNLNIKYMGVYRPMNASGQNVIKYPDGYMRQEPSKDGATFLYNNVIYTWDAIIKRWVLPNGECWDEQLHNPSFFITQNNLPAGKGNRYIQLTLPIQESNLSASDNNKKDFYVINDNKNKKENEEKEKQRTFFNNNKTNKFACECGAWINGENAVHSTWCRLYIGKK